MTRGRFTIIDRYIFGELMSPFFLGLATITLVLFIQKMFRLAELVISKGVSLAATVELFFLILPGFLVVTIPMSTLLASIIAFSRLSSDSEITAMKASRVSLYRMLKPVAILAGLTCFVTAVISLFVLPGANRALKQHMFNMVKSSAMVAIEAGSFTNKFNGLIIYVDKMKSADKLEGIFLSDERAAKDSFVITARRGRLIADQQS
ncbi:MAG TPA: LptF/LptG family permease, partial [Nitrospirota bacterium]|nr:LptF/LptG family permease [Nitrospirota bacterium]